MIPIQYLSCSEIEDESNERTRQIHFCFYAKSSEVETHAEQRTGFAGVVDEAIAARTRASVVLQMSVLDEGMSRPLLNLVG